MELLYNKNLRLNLRTQYQQKAGTKLGKSKKKTLTGYREGGTFPTVNHRKENLISQVMLSKT